MKFKIEVDIGYLEEDESMDKAIKEAIIEQSAEKVSNFIYNYQSKEEMKNEIYKNVVNSVASQIKPIVMEKLSANVEQIADRVMRGLLKEQFNKK